MENDNRKVITVAFVLASVLAASVVEVIEGVLAVNFSAVARFRALSAVQHGLPVGVGIVTFLILQTNKKTVAWADECVSEIRKVVWPSQKETTAMTMVCCVMLLLAGAWFGLFDYLSGSLVKMLIKM